MAQQEEEHAKLLRENYLDLINKLKPCLFLDQLSGHLSPDVILEVRELPSDVRAADKLVSHLMKGPYSWFRAFLAVIAGLYPDVFQLLASQDPTDDEYLSYIKPLQERLKTTITQKQPTSYQQLGADVKYIKPQFFMKDCVQSNTDEHADQECTSSPSMKRHCARSKQDSAYFTDSWHVDKQEDQNDVQCCNEDDLLQRAAGGPTLLSGRAGVGKTTFIGHLAKQWANQQLEDTHDLLFMLNIRKLISSPIRLDSINLATLLQKYTEFPVESGQPDKGLTTWLDNNQRRVHFIVDGLDELSQFQEHLRDVPKFSMHDKTTPLNWAINLLRKDILSESCLIIASRPFPELQYLSIKKEIVLDGFTEDGVKEYIAKNVKPAEKERVFVAIHSNPVFLSLCRLPFYCAILSTIFSRDTKGEITYNMATYTRITEYIIYFLANIHTGPNRLMSKCLKETLRNLEDLAFLGLPQQGHLSRLIFDQEHLNEVGICDDDLDKIKKCGLLSIHQDDVLGLHVEFIHHSVQDFLAMRKLLCSSKQELQNYLKGCTHHSSNMNLLYLCGLGLDNDLGRFLPKIKHQNDEMLQDLLQEVFSMSQDEAPHKQLHLANLIHESQSPEIAQRLSSSVLDDQRELMLKGHLTAVDLAALKFVLKDSPDLHQIYVQFTTLYTPGAKEVGRLIQSASSLQRVDLYHCSFSEQSFTTLVDSMSESHSLEHLWLNEITVDGEQALSRACMKSVCHAVTTCPCLQVLYITSLLLYDGGGECLFEALQHLCHIKLNGVGMNIECAGFIAAGVASSLILKELMVRFNEEFQVIILEGIKRNKSIEKLGLMFLTLSPQAWLIVCDIVRHSVCLTKLYLHFTLVDDDKVRDLCEAVRKSASLRELDVFIGNSLSETGRNLLRNLPRWVEVNMWGGRESSV